MDSEHTLTVSIYKGMLRMHLKCRAADDAPCRVDSGDADGGNCLGQLALDDFGAEACKDMIFIQNMPVIVDTTDSEEVWVKQA